MSEMVEKVARLISERCNGIQWEAASERTRANCTDDARAILRAMREPNDEMVEKSGLSCTYEEIVWGWRTMIDAALSPLPLTEE